MVATDDLQDHFVTASALLDDRDREKSTWVWNISYSSGVRRVFFCRRRCGRRIFPTSHQARDAERRGRFLAKAQAPRKDHRVDTSKAWS